MSTYIQEIPGENMPDGEEEKTAADKLNDVVSQLKEMEHYARSNVEKLTEFWLLFDDEMKEKELTKKMEQLLNCQNEFHERVQGVIEACEERRDSEKPKES